MCIRDRYSSFLNGRFSYIDKNNYKFFDYKMFGNFITNYKLVFQLGLIPENLEYAVTARAYGKNASFNTDVSGGILDETKGNVIDIDKHKSGSLEIIGTDYGLVEKPNLIVLKIKLSVNGSYTCLLYTSLPNGETSRTRFFPPLRSARRTLRLQEVAPYAFLCFFLQLQTLPSVTLRLIMPR